LTAFGNTFARSLSFLIRAYNEPLKVLQFLRKIVCCLILRVSTRFELSTLSSCMSRTTTPSSPVTDPRHVMVLTNNDLLEDMMMCQFSQSLSQHESFRSAFYPNSNRCFQRA
jgi:hypothetical protein